MPRKIPGKTDKPHHWRRLFVREWREHRGMTQEQLAERAGMTTASLSRIERGLQPYHQGTLDALAGALHCDPVDLLTRNPLDPEAPWLIWERLKPAQRKQAIRLLKALVEDEAA